MSSSLWLYLSIKSPSLYFVYMPRCGVFFFFFWPFFGKLTRCVEDLVSSMRRQFQFLFRKKEKKKRKKKRGTGSLLWLKKIKQTQLKKKTYNFSIVWTGYPVGPTPRWVFRYCWSHRAAWGTHSYFGSTYNFYIWVLVYINKVINQSQRFI